MMKNELSKPYWNTRYENHDFPWNLNTVSPPIKAYIDQLEDKTIKILVPGAGYGHEVEYLWNKGFKNVFINEFSEEALEGFKRRVNNFPDNLIISEDFFKIENSFDLIIEQTFFCALKPENRSKYADKMDELLAIDGKIIGLLFSFEKNDGPPFGGNRIEYLKLFKPYFKINTLEPSYNSVDDRQGKELFFIFEKQ